MLTHTKSSISKTAKPRAARLAGVVLKGASIGAVASVCSGAYAQGFVDPVALVKQRIKASPAAMAKIGEGVDVTNLVLVDRQRSGKAVFDFAKGKPAVPGTVVLQDQTANGCAPTDYVANVEVSRSSQASEQMSVTDTMGGSTTVEVGFDSPVASASVSQTFDYSSANTRGTSKAYETKWSSSVNVPVPAGRRIRIQFQVSTFEYRDVPWYADVAVDGMADVSYASDFEVCVWENSVWRGGKKCWVTRDRYAQPYLWNEKYDNGKALAVPGFTAYAAISAVRTRGAGKVSFWSGPNYGGWMWQQQNTKEFSDLSVGYGSGANPNDRFQAMLIEPAFGTKRVAVAELLPAADQRSFRIHGVFQGVSGVEGNWIAADDGPAVCPGIVRPSASAPRTTGATSGGAAVGTLAQGAGTLVQNNLTNARPIQGTVLSTVRPHGR